MPIFVAINKGREFCAKELSLKYLSQSNWRVLVDLVLECGSRASTEFTLFPSSFQIQANGSVPLDCAPCFIKNPAVFFTAV